MLDFDANAELAHATAALMRTCAVVTVQTMTTSACRGLSLWSDMLRSREARPQRAPVRAGAAHPFEMLWRLSSPTDWMPKADAWPLGGWGWNPYAAAWDRAAYAAWTPFGNWSGWGRACWPAARGLMSPASPISTTIAAAAHQAAYASYRSAGGHAVAQVIVPTADQVVSGTARVTFTQMQSMLGLWRAALGV